MAIFEIYIFLKKKSFEKLYNLGPIALLGAHLLIYKTIWLGAHLLIYKTIWCLKSKPYNLEPIALLGAHLLIYNTIHIIAPDSWK